MLVEINNLRKVARRCLAGEPLEDDVSNWLGTSLQDFLERRSGTVEDAFGLHAPQGGVPWWMEDAIRTRDAALRDLAERFHAERSVSRQAQEILLRGEMPERYRSTRTERLWRAFNTKER